MTSVRVGSRTSTIRVRVLRAVRRGTRHFAIDLAVRVRLTLGPSAAVDMDVVARTVHDRSAAEGAEQPESLALDVARQCMLQSTDVLRTQVDIRSRGWDRLDIGGRPRERDLIGPAGETRVARAVVTHDVARVAAGFNGMLLLTAGDSDDGADRPLVQRLSALWTYGWTEVPYETQWQQVRRGLTEAYAERGTLTGGALAESLGRAVIEESPPVCMIQVRLGVLPDAAVHGRVLRRNEAAE